MKCTAGAAELFDRALEKDTSFDKSVGDSQNRNKLKEVCHLWKITGVVYHVQNEAANVIWYLQWYFQSHIVV